MECFVGYSTCALLSLALPRMIPSLSTNRKSSIKLFLLSTIIVLFKLIILLAIHSRWTSNQVLMSAKFKKLTADTPLHLGNKFKVHVFIKLRRLNCKNCSEPICFQTRPPKNVCVSKSAATSNWSCNWCSLLNFWSLCEMHSSCFSQKARYNKSLSINFGSLMPRVPKSAGCFRPAMWFHWSTVLESNISAILLATKTSCFLSFLLIHYDTKFQSVRMKILKLHSASLTHN